MSQPDLFDPVASENAKQQGMKKAGEHKVDVLALARHVAMEYAKSHGGICHADIVGVLLRQQHGIDTLGPAAGSIFKTAEWSWTGDWIKSVRVTNHSRMLRVWQLVSL